MPTSRDVARVAGVSQSTVSYVLSGKRPISNQTRCRVEAAIEHLTYYPNAGARALASQRTQVIGLVVPFGSGADPWALLPFIEMIATLSREHDHELLLVTAQEGASTLQRLAGRKLCDAIVLMDLAVDDGRVEVSSRLGVPVVLIGVPRDPAGLHCVDLNFEAAAHLAVAELVETAHDRIVVIGHPDEVIRRRLNFVGRFADAAQEAARVNRVRLEVVAPVEWGKAAAADAVDRALEGRAQDERLGLVVVNAHAVQPVLRALQERGLVPARDVSVVAIGSNEAAQDTEPPVTNVSVEAREVSRLAMRTVFFLLGLESREEPEPVQLVTPRLHRRRTVMPRP